MCLPPAKRHLKKKNIPKYEKKCFYIHADYKTDENASRRKHAEDQMAHGTGGRDYSKLNLMPEAAGDRALNN